MLHRKAIDISPQDFTITKSRASVVDYLPGITPTYAQIFVKNPEALSNWMAYLEPLNLSCWAAILAIFLLVPLFIAGISSYGTYKNK